MNVLVSAFISRAGSAPDCIVRAWQEGAFDLVVWPTLLSELADVLSRPKFRRQAADGRAEAYVAAIAADAVCVDDPHERPLVSADSDDDYLVALARMAGAGRIVSGDGHLTTLDQPDPPVLTPREFAELL